METTVQDQGTPELAKAYDHRAVEPRWYAFWTEKGYFQAQDGSSKPAFSIVLPPPNVTGSLHLGHALGDSLSDILVRWKRMQGFNALWLPGTDHAGIATQMIVEKELKKTEGKSRHDLGRAEFLKRVWAWKEKYGSRIVEQMKTLGLSLDWRRERFTMDEGLSEAVREVFVRLHEEGLIYRERKLINWCPRCHTALSDLEVNYEENHKGELWSFAYPLADGPGEIVVATTRPETMLGDTAVAVHPEDARYEALVGRKVKHPLLDREIPIIADAILVDPAFGTGAVKVTPAHDFNDFEVGQRHKLPLIEILELDGRMSAAAGPLAGLDRFEARKEVKRLIGEKGLDRGTKPHLLPLGRCQRCETVLEPMLSNQWFVRIAPLAGPAIEAVKEGRTRFVPEQWTNTYMGWMEKIHDWCISRQLWWGHQIPAWYCPNGHVAVARQAPSVCKECGSLDLKQDEDVLDTWFSSALWPFSTLGWPRQTEALSTFYPTSVMETGHDIIFFWVARMMMMGLHFMKDVPFRDVVLHAMVRDEKGQKMSKTKGNVIDPLDITAQFGADALRFTLAALTAQGRDIKLAKERIEGYRAFANKLWNATRFALMNLAGYADTQGDVHASAKTAADRWILARLQRAVNEANAALEAYKFNEACSTVYQFIWHELCDWYIELAKESLYGEDAASKRATQAVLVHCLETSYRLLHPMMPFITEELWQTLAATVKAKWGESIMIAPYPKPGPVDEGAERSFAPVVGIVEAIRTIRGEMNVPPRAEVSVDAAVEDADALRTVRAELARVARLAKTLGEPRLHPGKATPRAPQTAVQTGAGFEVRVKLAGAVDFAAEGERIGRELARLEGELSGIRKRIENPSFVAKAPAEVVEKDRNRARELEEQRHKLEAHRRVLAGGEEEAMEEKKPEAPPSAPPAPTKTPAPVDLGAELRDEVERVVQRGEEERRQVSQVLEKFKEGVAKALPPDDAKAHRDLGLAYMQMGLVDEAVRELNIARAAEDKAGAKRPARKAAPAARKKARPAVKPKPKAKAKRAAPKKKAAARRGKAARGGAAKTKRAPARGGKGKPGGRKK